jgi:hypothetical protein
MNFTLKVKLYEIMYIHKYNCMTQRRNTGILNLFLLNKTILTLIVIPVVLILSGCAKDEDNPVNPGQSSITTVSGKVIDNWGNSIGNVKVEINSVIYQTSSDGIFTFSNVKVPYDVSVYTYGKNVVTFKGLITSTPSLPVEYNYTIPGYSSEVNVIIPPMNPNQKALVQFYDSTGMFINDLIFSNSLSGILEVQWYGKPESFGKIVLWICTYENNWNILSYDKYGEKPITVQNNLPGRIVFYDYDLNTNPIDSSVSGNLVLPAGFTVDQKTAGMNRYNFANLYEFGVIDNTVILNNNQYSAFIPALAGGIYRYYVKFGIYKPGTLRSAMKVSEIILNGANTIGFNDIPELLSPDDNAQNVNYQTLFSFSKTSPPGVYKISFSYSSGGFSVWRNFYTSTESFYLSLLSDNSFNISDNSVCSWHVAKITGFSNLDNYISIPPAKNTKCREVLQTESRDFNFKNNK